jgi:hypothetical protein
VAPSGLLISFYKKELSVWAVAARRQEEDMKITVSTIHTCLQAFKKVAIEAKENLTSKLRAQTHADPLA